MAKLPVLVAAAIVSIGAGVAGFERDLSDLTISDALGVARNSTDAARRAYHGNYYIPTGPLPISSISIVTEFRRVVIAAEQRLRLADRLWGLREAREVLRPIRNKFDIVAELNFHPQNAYATMPSFQIVLVPKEGPEIGPQQNSSTPKYTLLSASPSDQLFYPYPPPSAPIGPGAEPIIGAWVTASFDALEIDPNAYLLVVVREGAKDLARVAVDFGRLR